MNKKRVIILLSTFTILLVVGALLALMAETHPYGPNDWRYGIQTAAEGVRMRLITEPAARFEYALRVSDYCLADLALADTAGHIDKAARALAKALDFASEVINTQEAGEAETMLGALKVLFIRANLVLQAIRGELATPAVVQLRNEINAALTGTTVVGSSGDGGSQLMLEVPIPFLVATYDHAQIALSGAHAKLECLDCHLAGVYSGTQAECRACHQIPEAGAHIAGLTGHMQPDNMNLSQLYPNHFEGECEECHGLESWDPIAFNHIGVLECISCHEEDVPVDATDPEVLAHYPGDCMLCHTDTEDWQVAEYSHNRSSDCLSCHDWEKPEAHYVEIPFDCQTCHTYTDAWEHTSHHEGYTDCVSCHEGETPEEHYEGQCYACHQTDDWLDIRFDHTNYMEMSCTTCHEKPDVHFPGECQTCHTTAYWSPAETAHSALANCNYCHMSSVPLYHYVGACEGCHQSFTSWFDTVFSHDAGLLATECTTCHLKDAPNNHYCYDCCRCHNTNEWDQIYFDHVGAVNCLECHTPDTPPNHYLGMCSDCHFAGTSWTSVEFDHTLYTDCLDCHIDDAPRLHYNGQCSLCHYIDTWTHIDFYHGTTYTDCVYCHTDDAPANHYDLQCSSCHITDNWVQVDYLHNEAPFNCLELPHDTGRGSLYQRMPGVPQRDGLACDQLHAHRRVSELFGVPRGADGALAGAVLELP